MSAGAKGGGSVPVVHLSRAQLRALRAAAVFVLEVPFGRAAPAVAALRRRAGKNWRQTMLGAVAAVTNGLEESIYLVEPKSRRASPPSPPAEPTK